MGTRGLVGVRYGEELHLIFQSTNASPDYLGAEIIDFIQSLQTDPARMLIFKENIQKVEWVNNTSKPTFGQIEKLNGYPEFLIHYNPKEDWYTQFIFDPLACFEYVILYGLSVIPEHVNGVLGEYNVFIDYAYVLDLNEGVLELYRNCCKVKEVSFEELSSTKKDNWIVAFGAWEEM